MPKARVITAVAFILLIAITLGACAPNGQLPILREAPDFTLTNQDGRIVRLSDFRGKVVVMDFFYTNCHDACLTMNYSLKFVQDQLEAGLKQDLVLISVSFDPLDTPEVLKQHAASLKFNIPGWHFLTGTPEQIRQLADDYGVTYRAVDVADHERNETTVAGHVHEGSAFYHNIVIALIDRDGMDRKIYGPLFVPETAEMMLDTISLLS